VVLNFRILKIISDKNIDQAVYYQLIGPSSFIHAKIGTTQIFYFFLPIQIHVLQYFADYITTGGGGGGGVAFSAGPASIPYFEASKPS
jgi:hypothetical protein